MEVSCFRTAANSAVAISALSIFQHFFFLPEVAALTAYYYTREHLLQKPSCCDRGLALPIIFSTPDSLGGASLSPLSPALSSPGSALARWLHFAKHSFVSCECEIRTVQLQKNVFFGLSPLAVPLWQEGGDWKVEERRA